MRSKLESQESADDVFIKTLSRLTDDVGDKQGEMLLEARRGQSKATSSLWTSVTCFAHNQQEGERCDCVKISPRTYVLDICDIHDSTHLSQTWKRRMD
jgi:hypothetical protein